MASQVIVIGDQQPFIAAIVTLDVDELAKWAEDNGARAFAQSDLTRELLEDDRETLRQEISTAIEAANERVSRAESIREFRILSSDFTIETNELTPTLKMKRKVIASRHRVVIEEIYRPR